MQKILRPYYKKRLTIAAVRNLVLQLESAIFVVDVHQ